MSFTPQKQSKFIERFPPPTLQPQPRDIVEVPVRHLPAAELGQSLVKGIHLILAEVDPELGYLVKLMLCEFHGTYCDLMEIDGAYYNLMGLTDLTYYDFSWDFMGFPMI